MERTELLIIGAGAAGISAACAAWDAGCRDIVLTDRLPYPGGVLPQCLHEGFGLAAYGSELTGPAYAARLTGSAGRDKRKDRCPVRQRRVGRDPF